MKYISESKIFTSWKNLIEEREDAGERAPYNKFFAVLDILKSLNIPTGNVIQSNVQYELSTSALSNSLQSKFYFGEDLKDYNSNEIWHVVFPSDWQSNVLNTFLKGIPLSITDVAAVCMQREAFSDTVTSYDVIQLFKSLYRLSDAENIFFTLDEDDISFSNSISSRKNIYNRFKTFFQVSESTSYTIGFERKMIAANPGELTRGPFTQPLYAGLENLKCLLITNFNISEYYNLAPARNAITNKAFNTEISYNKIYFGPPGTGKSNKITEYTNEANSIRITFHPDTDYSSFVGTYKPTVNPEIAGGITYRFVPQQFLQAYIKAWESDINIYLVIEEINRGNCAQIFGDIFQLIDRNSEGYSVYPIDTDADLSKYLTSYFEGERAKGGENANKAMRYLNYFNDVSGKLVLPNNLFIHATMNTSDQSLFPIDSAFKRRWDWEYVPIEFNNTEANEYKIMIGTGLYSWRSVIEAINRKIEIVTESEDKKLGQFFIKSFDGKISEKVFKSKVMFYLWNDVLRDESKSDDRFFFRTKALRTDVDDNPFSFNDLFSGDSIELLSNFMNYLNIERIE